MTLKGGDRVLRGCRPRIRSDPLRGPYAPSREDEEIFVLRRQLSALPPGGILLSRVNKDQGFDRGKVRGPPRNDEIRKLNESKAREKHRYEEAESGHQYDTLQLGLGLSASCTKFVSGVP